MATSRRAQRHPRVACGRRGARASTWGTRRLHRFGPLRSRQLSAGPSRRNAARQARSVQGPVLSGRQERCQLLTVNSLGYAVPVVTRRVSSSAGSLRPTVAPHSDAREPCRVVFSAVSSAKARSVRCSWRVSAPRVSMSCLMVDAGAPAVVSVTSCWASSCTTSALACTHCASAGPSGEPGAAVVSAPNRPCDSPNGPAVK